MQKLSEMIRMTPKTSVLEVPCEVVAGHRASKYVEVAISKTVIVLVDGMSRPIELNAAVRVCSACFNMFAYDVMLNAKFLDDGNG